MPRDATSENVQNIDQQIKTIKHKLDQLGNSNSNLKDKLNFVLGYLYYLKKDYAVAESIFINGLNAKNILFDYTSYYLAKLAVLNDKFKKALSYLESIDLSKSTIRADIIELFGLCYYELGLLSKAAEYYQNLIKNFPRTKARTLELLLVLSNIYRNLNDFVQENKILREIILNYPTSSVTSHIKKRFKEQKYVLYDDNKLDDFKESLLKEANGFFEERDFKTAIKLYKKYLKLFKNDHNKLIVLNRLKYCYKLINEDAAFSSILEETVNLAPDEGSLYALGINYFSNEKYKKASDIFRKLIVSFPASQKIHRYLYNLARIYEVTNDYKRAEYFFLKVINEADANINSDEKKYIMKSMFKRAWIYFKQKKYYQTIEKLKQYLPEHQSREERNRILYWIGRCYEHLGLSKESTNYYKQIIENDKYSYYALKAQENLYGSIPKTQFPENPASLRYKTRTVFMSKSDKLKLEKVEFFLFYDLQEFAQNEIKAINNKWVELPWDSGTYMYSSISSVLTGRKHPFPFYLAALNYQIGNILTSIRLLNKITYDSFKSLPPYSVLLLWPKAYYEIIKTNAEQIILDPYIALAIIRQESAFNPEAVSVANAQGLMQILPTVATSVAKRYKIRKYDLFKPKDNIKIAIRHLKEELTRYPNLIYALAAYNAGGEAVKRWIKNYAMDSLEEFIEEIPYDETHYYVKNVLRNYINYKRFYSEASNLFTGTK